MAGPGGETVGAVAIRVLPKTNNFAPALKKFLTRMEQRHRLDIPVNIDTKGVAESLRQTTDRLRPPPVELPVKPDTQELSRFQRVAQSLNQAMTRMTASGAKAASRIANLGAAALAAGPALGGIATAALLIPGAIATVAAPIAALTLGMKGVKEAAKVAKPALDSLKATLSGTFKTGLTPVFQDLANTLIPGVTDGMKSIATVITEMAQGFTNVVTSASGMATIKNILSNVANTMTALKPAIAPLTETFLQLAEVGSSVLPKLAKSIATFAQNFGKVIDQLASTGTLKEAFTGLLSIVRPLSDVILMLVKSGVQFMAKFATPMKDAFSQVADIISVLTPILLEMSGIFLKLLAPALKGVKIALEVLSPLFKAISKVFQFLMPFLKPFATVLGVIAVAIGIWTVAQWALNAALYANPIGLIVVAIAALVAAVIWAWNNVDWFRNGLIAVWNAIKIATQAVWNFLKGVFAWIGRAAVNVGNFFKNMGQTIATVWNNVIGWIVNAWNSIVSAVSSGVTNVLNWVGSIPGKVKAFFANAWNWLVSAGADVVRGLLNGIQNAWGAVVGWISGAVGGLIDSVKGMFGIASPSKVFMEIGQYTAEGLAVGIRRGSGEAIKEAERMAKRTTKSASANWDATIRSETYGDLTASLAEAVAGMSFVMDESGGKVMAKVVNQANNKLARR